MRYTDNGARLSPDQTYRYLLWREWGLPGPRKTALFIMLNPSTADATLDDATIRRCVGFAHDWGCNRLEVANLFAFRARDPKDLTRAKEPVGPDNFRTLKLAADRADFIVCAWGKHGDYMGQAHRVKDVILYRHQLHALHFLANGTPGHPLYLPSDSKLKRFR